ncbi:hypothetical protein B296_00009649 [Ensete ventricosum]|uniref:Uncharacterized protein n=1 Tax=Ensete ventricosum TaxID=4639 RepID=A0A427B7P9_ENSVE|nr:hypothetical protein B296_00009649 [Ensete ventricosum]
MYWTSQTPAWPVGTNLQSLILDILGLVTKSWEDSTLNKIVELTKEGQLNKPKLERWLDEFGEYYSKVVVVLSLGVALLGPFIFKWPFIGNSVVNIRFEWFFIEFCLVVSRGSVYRALGFMVAASPCALAVAPLAYATAISACARKVIVNNFFQLLNPTDFYDIP